MHIDSGAIFKALADDTHDFICMIDDNFRVMSANKAAGRFFGLDASVIPGYGVDALLPREIAGDFFRRLKKVFVSGRAHFYEAKIVPGKRASPKKVGLVPVEESPGKVAAVMVVIRNLSDSKTLQEGPQIQQRLADNANSGKTGVKRSKGSLKRRMADREKTERALRESEEKYHNLFQHSRDAVFVHDLEGNVIDANQKAAALFGYTKTELLSLKIFNLHPEDARSKSKLALETVERAGAVDYEIDFQKKNGSIFAGAVSSSIFEARKQKLVQALVRDITSQRRAEQLQSALFNITQATSAADSLEELLRIIQKQLGTLIDTTNFYVALYDKETDMYSFPFVRDECEQDDAFSSQELKKSLTDYVRRKGKPLLADKRVHEGLIASGEVDLVGADSQIWMGAPLRTQEGVIGVVAVQSYGGDAVYSGIDLELLSYISEHVAMAINRKRAEERIKASLKEKNVLLKEIHHRVKNNMQIISSLLRLQSRELENEKARKIFEISQNRIKSIALIHETLYQSEDLASIDFSNYIRKLTTHLFSLFKPEGTELELDLDVQEIPLNINKAIPCGLIVNELVSNSLKHAFSPGEKGKISVRLSKNDGSFTLVVEDSGSGMPEELAGGKTKSLGLQIVHDLVQQLDGAIDFDSGRGTCFTISWKEETVDF